MGAHHRPAPRQFRSHRYLLGIHQLFIRLLGRIRRIQHPLACLVLPDDANHRSGGAGRTCCASDSQSESARVFALAHPRHPHHLHSFQPHRYPAPDPALPHHPGPADLQRAVNHRLLHSAGIADVGLQAPASPRGRIPDGHPLCQRPDHPLRQHLSCLQATNPGRRPAGRHPTGEYPLRRTHPASGLQAAKHPRRARRIPGYHPLLENRYAIGEGL